MSQDRIWLACRKCGELQLLCKYFSSGAGHVDGDQIQHYLDKHLHECFQLPGDLGFDPRFELLTDSVASGLEGIRAVFSSASWPP